MCGTTSWPCLPFYSMVISKVTQYSKYVDTDLTLGLHLLPNDYVFLMLCTLIVYPVKCETLSMTHGLFISLTLLSQVCDFTLSERRVHRSVFTCVCLRACIFLWVYVRVCVWHLGPVVMTWACHTHCLLLNNTCYLRHSIEYRTCLLRCAFS